MGQDRLFENSLKLNLIPNSRAKLICRFFLIEELWQGLILTTRKFLLDDYKTWLSLEHTLGKNGFTSPVFCEIFFVQITLGIQID